MADVAIKCGEFVAVQFLGTLQVRVAARDTAGFMFSWIHCGSLPSVKGALLVD